MLEPLRYGCPPHGGIAFGIDRIAALMAGENSIREVIAFPKNTNAACLLTGAPAPVDAEQLDALKLELKKDAVAVVGSEALCCSGALAVVGQLQHEAARPPAGRCGLPSHSIRLSFNAPQPGSQCRRPA